MCLIFDVIKSNIPWFITLPLINKDNSLFKFPRAPENMSGDWDTVSMYYLPSYWVSTCTAGLGTHFNTAMIPAEMSYVNHN